MLGLVLVVAWVGNVTFIVADNYFLRGQFPAAGEDAPTLLKTAIALDPYNDMYRSMLGQSYQNQMLAWINQAQQEQTAGHRPVELAAAGDAVASGRRGVLQGDHLDRPDRVRQLPVPLRPLQPGGAYVDPAYFNDAIKAADRGIAAEPFGPGVRMQKALAQASMGDTAGAAVTLAAAVDMDPNYVEIRGLYAQVLTEAGRLQDALAQYKILQAKDPSNTTYPAAIKSLEASISPGASATPTP